MTFCAWSEKTAKKKRGGVGGGGTQSYSRQMLSRRDKSSLGLYLERSSSAFLFLKLNDSWEACPALPNAGCRENVPGALRGPLWAACPLCPRFCDPAETPIFSPSGFSSDTCVTCTSRLLLKALALESHGMFCYDRALLARAVGWT